MSPTGPALLWAFASLICIHVSKTETVDFENLDRMTPVKRLFMNAYGRQGKRFDDKSADSAMGISSPVDYLRTQLRRTLPLTGRNFQASDGIRGDVSVEDATLECRATLGRAFDAIMNRCGAH